MIPEKLQINTAGWVNGITHHVTLNHGSGMAVPSGVLGVVMHTMVGNLPGTDAEFMNPANQVSAHFGIAQDGTTIQWVDLIGGDVAWAEMAGNMQWYSIEHADNGNPDIPLTSAQINRSAQLVELMSRVGHFPLQEANSVTEEGYGVHYMGGAAWGGHTCPDSPPSHVRSNQRPAILTLAKYIHAGVPVPPGQWLNPAAWSWQSVSISGTGLNGNKYTFAYNTRAKTWPHSGSIPPGQWLNPSVWSWENVAITGKGLNGKFYTFTYEDSTNTWER